MKKLIAILTLLIVTAVALELAAQTGSRWASNRYQPVADFLGADATLSKWYMQYVDTTRGEVTFNDFLKKLSSSEVLKQRSRRAGLSHNQLYSPIVTLLEKDWSALDEMSKQELATIKLSILELDIALAAVDATLPNTAHEEFRREVIRGAKPLTEVAKLPNTAVEAMSFTIMDHRVTERINSASPKSNPPLRVEPVQNPNLDSQYKFQ